MKVATLVFVSSLLLSGVAAAQSGSAADQAALKALETKWDAASVKGDTATLGGLFADTLVSTNAEGKVRTKAEMLGAIKSGEVKFLSSKVDDMKVFVHGDVAVVNGRWTGKVVEKGKTVDSTERFTDTFIRQNGAWKCIASHSSVIK